jgi:hypothetical protein
MVMTHAGSSVGSVILATDSGEKEGVFGMNPIPRRGSAKKGSPTACLDTIVAFYVKAP